METYITLLATDTYAPGALVLAHRLRDLASTRQIVCLVTPDIPDRTRQLLYKVFDSVIEVDALKSQNRGSLLLLGRPELDITITKIQVWSLTQYSKVVFLDADVLPIRNMDELFSRPAFSAAPDTGWPDCFNSGVFVAQPSRAVYQELVDLANTKGSFDGGDQGLLNTYFSSWPETNEHRLPFTFNTTPSASYSYVPAYVEFRHQISIIHFIGRDKPWLLQRFTDGSVFYRGSHVEFVQLWWDTWNKHYGKMKPSEIRNENAQILQSQNQVGSWQSTPVLIESQQDAAWDTPDIHRDVDKIQQKLYKEDAAPSFKRSHAFEATPNSITTWRQLKDGYQIQEKYTSVKSSNNIRNSSSQTSQSRCNAAEAKATLENACIADTTSASGGVEAEKENTPVEITNADDSDYTEPRHPIEPSLTVDKTKSSLQPKSSLQLDMEMQSLPVQNSSSEQDNSLCIEEKGGKALQFPSYDSYRFPDLKRGPKHRGYSGPFQPRTVAEATTFKYKLQAPLKIYKRYQ